MRRSAIALIPALLLFACGSVTEGGGDAPTIESISPDRGPVIGGTEVAVTGTGLSAGDEAEVPRVLLGEVAVAEVTVQDDTMLTFVTPPGEKGRLLDLVVFHDEGFARLPAAFAYDGDELSVTEVSPDHDNVSGGDTITVSGSGFAGLPDTLTITLGAAEISDFQVESDTEITATVPEAADPAFAWIDLVIESENEAAVLEEAFRYTKQGLLISTSRSGAGNPRDILYLDPETLETSRVSEAQIPIAKMTAGPGGTLFATNFCCDELVFTVDPLTGRTNVIGLFEDPEGLDARARSLAFIGSQLYAFTNRGNRLSTVDTDTGQYLNIGDTALSTSRCSCIAFRDSQSLHMIDNFNGNLLRLNVSDSTTTNGPALSGLDYPCRGMVELDGTLFAVTKGTEGELNNRSLSDVVTVDPGNGVVTVLGTLPLGVSTIVATPDSF